MDFPAAHYADDLVPRFLEAQRATHQLGVRRARLGQGDGALEAQKVRGVQHVDVEHMAFDPLAAVEESSQRPQGRRQGHAEDLLQRVNARHLIRHRADAADASSDVRHLQGRATAQEGFVEARRFVDAQLDCIHLAVAQPDGQGPLSFDPGQRLDGDGTGSIRAGFRHGLLPCSYLPPRRGTPAPRR